MGEAGDKSASDGIVTGRHDDGNGLGRLLGCLGYGHAPHHHEVYRQAHQLGCQDWQFCYLLRIAGLDDDILALDVAQLTQPLLETHLLKSTLRRTELQEPDVRGFSWRLSLERQLPARR